MKIDLDLTKFRLKMNQINIDASINYSLEEQEEWLMECLSEDITFAIIKSTLDRAMQQLYAWKGFTSEVDMLIKKEVNGDKVRGHDYLKLWMRCFFVIEYDVNYVIAETASHEFLQNRLTHSQKNELINMMRGRKHG